MIPQELINFFWVFGGTVAGGLVVAEYSIYRMRQTINKALKGSPFEMFLGKGQGEKGDSTNG